MSERLILFARRPRLGAVKTRLVPPLSAEQALVLYEAFLEDQLRFVRSLAAPGREVELSTDETWAPQGKLAAAVGEMTRTEQGAGDLGDRLHRAFVRSRAGGAERTVIVGADAPTLPPEHVEEAFRRLVAGAPAVVSPADDGGYVLIALADPSAALFDGIPWGGSDVMATTRRRAKAEGIALVEIAPWYDVDEAESLARLEREVETSAGLRRAPATARALVAPPLSRATAEDG
jgi:rSAM/selenodomain-associated transferase 1